MTEQTPNPPKGVWSTVDSEDGQRTIKQHFYIPYKRGKFYEDEYIGNMAACSRRIGIADENERYLTVEEISIYSEEVRVNCCKKCLKLSKQH